MARPAPASLLRFYQQISNGGSSDTTVYSVNWVCEILSPSTASLDRVKKLAVYAREQVAHAWLIDPLARTLEVLRLEAGRWTILATHSGADVVCAEPFTEIELELSALPPGRGHDVWRPGHRNLKGTNTRGRAIGQNVIELSLLQILQTIVTDAEGERRRLIFSPRAEVFLRLQTSNFRLATSRMAARAARIVVSTSLAVCAAERNHASNCDGGG